MKTIGLPISRKKNEKRICLLPEHLDYIKYPHMLYFETGYGENLGFSDDDFMEKGANVVSSEAVFDCDVICDPKIGDAEYVERLAPGKILFGYFHAVQNKDLTDVLLRGMHRVVAWEDMYYKGRHIFYRNNELAGEAAIMHAFTIYGLLPYHCKVALIGRGNVARGAMKILNSLGAEITVYDRKTEGLLREEIGNYDVIVNAVLWDTSREDHIIYRKDLQNMKRNSLIIDISCDRNGGFETCIPTTIENPIYTIDSIMHYAVDHTPSLVFNAASKSFGDELIKYLDLIILDSYLDNETLKNALIIDRGNIIDNRINIFQNR